jgi:hypothetical protein
MDAFQYKLIVWKENGNGKANVKVALKCDNTGCR